MFILDSWDQNVKLNLQYYRYYFCFDYMGLATTMTVFTRKSVIDMQRRFHDVAYVSVYMQWFRIITFKISSEKGLLIPSNCTRKQ